MKLSKEKLAKKGWTKKEIEKTSQILDNINSKHIKYYKSSSQILYWMVLVVLTVCNFVVAVVLIPFLLVINPMQFYMINILLGLVFGLLFNTLINDIEHLERRHHIIAAIFIPFVSLINILIMTSVANRLAEMLKLTSNANPLLASLVFVVAFIAPYTIGIIRDKK